MTTITTTTNSRRMLYSMSDFNLANNTKFDVEFYLGDKEEPYFIDHVVGIENVLRNSPDKCLTREKMFDIFIERKAPKHCIMQVDDKGDMLGFIKIVKQ